MTHHDGSGHLLTRVKGGRFICVMMRHGLGRGRGRPFLGDLAWPACALVTGYQRAAIADPGAPCSLNAARGWVGAVRIPVTALMWNEAVPCKKITALFGDSPFLGVSPVARACWKKGHEVIGHRLAERYSLEIGGILGEKNGEVIIQALASRERISQFVLF